MNPRTKSSILNLQELVHKVLIFYTFSSATDLARPTRRCSPFLFLPRISNFRRDQIVSKRFGGFGVLFFIAATFGPVFLLLFFLFFFFVLSVTGFFAMALLLSHKIQISSKAEEKKQKLREIRVLGFWTWKEDAEKSGFFFSFFFLSGP